MHVFLSPHLDDAVFSCGGLIHQWVARGEPVHVITIMAGDPPEPLPDTPIIRELHGRWALGEHPTAPRRAEDIAALTHLGASWQHLDHPDCPYRTDATGAALYPTEASLFGTVHPDDPVRHLALDLPAAMQALYVPLGAGGHVDHQVVCQLGAAMGQNLPPTVPLFFYEEYPYSANGGEAVKLTGAAEVRLFGSIAIDAAKAAINVPLTPRIMALGAADLQHKIGAVQYYGSQLSTFWDDDADMERRIKAYTQEVAAQADAAQADPTLAAPSGAIRLWIWEKTTA